MGSSITLNVYVNKTELSGSRRFPLLPRSAELVLICGRFMEDLLDLKCVASDQPAAGLKLAVSHHCLSVLFVQRLIQTKQMTTNMYTNRDIQCFIQSSISSLGENVNRIYVIPYVQSLFIR